jgi:serine/threonine protein kinase
MEDAPNYAYIADIAKEATTLIVRREDIDAQNEAAIKISRGKSDRTAAEADILFMLKHDAIVELIDTIPTDNGPAFVLPLAVGGDFFDFLANRRRLQEENANYIMVRLLSALAHCHENGVWHRDVKLGNICGMREDIPDVILADVGYAVHVAGFAIAG